MDFSVGTASRTDAHRRNHQSIPLVRILCSHHVRTVTNDYTVRLHGHVFQLRKPAVPGLRGGKVTVEDRADGLKIRFQGKVLKFDDISAVLMKAAAGPKRTPKPKRHKPPYKPPADHPWRKRTPDRNVRSASG